MSAICVFDYGFAFEICIMHMVKNCSSIRAADIAGSNPMEKNVAHYDIPEVLEH